MTPRIPPPAAVPSAHAAGAVRGPEKKTGDPMRFVLSP